MMANLCRVGVALPFAAIACVTGAAAQETGAETASSAGDIIVTARRTEERLQDVPISITVFNQAQLADRNVTSARDLATYAPSLTANGRYGTENTSFAIRGFTQEQRTTASVAIYFADVVSPRGSGGGTTTGDGAGPGSFFDLQNVQVLRGPQGTLFGRNTTGGAVLLVPQKPTSSFEGYAEATIGNYDTRRLQGVLNLPLGEMARFRIGADLQKRDGYLKNISGVGPDRFADVDYVAARASLVVDLTSDLENYMIASYSRSDTNGQIPRLTNCYPTRGTAPFVAGILSCDQLARQDGGFYTVQNGLTDPVLSLEQWQVINTTTWQASDTLTIKNVASYAQLRNKTRSEAFGTYWRVGPMFQGRPTGLFAGRSATFVNIQHEPSLATADQSTFTEELQLQGRTGDDRLIWQAGGYLEVSNPLGRTGNLNPSALSCLDQSYACVDVVRGLQRLIGQSAPDNSLGYQVGQTAYRNVGLYGQATYKITDAFSVTGGLRYTWDRSTSTIQKSFYTFPDPAIPAQSVAQCTNAMLRVAGGINSNAQCEESFRQSSKAPTWLIDIDYKPIPDLLIYAKYSRGYRQGSTNPFSVEGYNTYEPEKVDTYEGGLKASWRGSAPGYLNVSGFYNDFRDQQVQTGFRDLLNRVAVNTAIVNAGKSRIYGAEVETGINLFSSLNLSASYAYLNTKVLELAEFPAPSTFIPGSFFNTPVITTTVGRPLTFAPEHKVSATATYTLPLAETAGRLSVGATYTYTDEIIATYSGTQGTLPAFSLLNLNLNWANVASLPVDLSLFATNVTGKKYFVQVNEQTSSGFVSKYLGEPRMYGVRLRYRFGD